MNLPNKITMVRIFLIPVFIICLLVTFPYHALIATIVFIVASASDSLDGHLARSRNLVTDFGKFMDPLADKLLVSSAFVCLVQLQLIPAWVVICILSREFAITGLRTLAAADGVVIAASKWGKAKTMSQMIAVIALLFYTTEIFHFAALLTFGTVMVYVALALTLYSGYDYFRLNKGVFKTM